MIKLNYNVLCVVRPGELTHAKKNVLRGHEFTLYSDTEFALFYRLIAGKKRYTGKHRNISRIIKRFYSKFFIESVFVGAFVLNNYYINVDFMNVKQDFMQYTKCS